MDVELAEALESYRGQKGALIAILQKIQEKLGYLPRELFPEVAKMCRVSVNEVFGVASFYAQFRFVRSGEHVVKVCLGTACHVRGGERIMHTVTQELGIKPGATTEDYKFTLERVACFGCCALSPVMVVDNTVYSKMNPARAKGILAQYRGRA
jgi:NADH-quinone oxidoreductase subunit E